MCKRKRCAALILSILCVITACGKKTAGGFSDGETVTVDYYCGRGEFLDLLTEKISEFNETEGKKEGVFIHLIPDVNGLSANLEVLMESGTHYDLCDFGENASWAGKGWVTDLKSLGDPEVDALLSGYSGLLTEGREVYGEAVTAVPMYLRPVKLLVNTDLFEANGLEYPETWEEVYECARVITEHGNGKAFGFGWSTWTEAWQKYCFELCYGSCGHWWDPESGTYDFSVYRKAAETVRRMREEGLILGADDENHDTVCAQFAEGMIGMLPYSSVGTFTDRFPAACSWTAVDPPGAGDVKGAYLTESGCGIDRVSYEAADERKKAAIRKAWLFLNSDRLISDLYGAGALIPAKESLKEGISVEGIPQWETYADLSGYEELLPCPDTALPLEGERLNVVFEKYLEGVLTFEEAAEDLNRRYNEAYRALKESGDLDVSPYERHEK